MQIYGTGCPTVISQRCSPSPCRALHSFPTRRSSDLSYKKPSIVSANAVDFHCRRTLSLYNSTRSTSVQEDHLDRKSTRLNSSHVAISYAVFCLKKKKNA